jgi:2,3-dihydroxy-p-cumate/2,3-dihydroxybenzoate 3,4-dioxygenase
MATPFRFKRLGYVVLGVSDLPRSIAFYRDTLGLDETPSDLKDAAFLRCSDAHHDIILCAAPEPLLLAVGWELESAADLDAAFDHVSALGLAPGRIPKAGRFAFQGDTFALALPDSGLRFEFFVGIDKADAFSARIANIVRIGHVVVGVPEPLRMAAHLTRSLGFRMSDEVDGLIAFLRAHPNPLHHSLAFSKAATPTLNHVNFMVSDIDDIGRALHRLKRADVPIVYGPGRHTPSDSIFLYFLEPDGMTLEYSFGMEEFPEYNPRDARTLPFAPQVMDSWGSVRDPRMGAKGRVAAFYEA